MRMPGRGEIGEIVDRTTGAKVPRADRVADGPTLLRMRTLVREVPVASHVRDYAAALVLATHPDRDDAAPMAGKYLRYGAGPRAAQAMILGGKVLALVAGRYNVAMADVRHMAAPALRHRIIRNFEAGAEGVDPDRIVADLLDHVPEPPE
jgi:MoxR-like ATPase